MSVTDPREAIKNYLDGEGRLKLWPKRKHREVLSYLADNFETGKQYTEKQVNEILNLHHTFGDPALLRRELFMKRFFDRIPDGSRYWRTNA